MNTDHAIHTFILTLNEEIHIARCIESVRAVSSSIEVVDSGSTDQTVEIAKRLGAEVIFRPFVTHAKQANFAIDHLSDRGGWLLRMDADEILALDSALVLKDTITSTSNDVAGILLRRRIVFLGRPMKWGGMDPVWQLRAWRNGTGRHEERWMDEHVIVSGRVIKSKAMIEDRNRKPLDQWVTKHIDYARREALDLMGQTRADMPSSAQAARKRWIKTQLYAHLPGPLRSTLYFLYRYIVLLGFLDGKEGFYFHVLQGFWYRSLVDAKIIEMRMARSLGC